MQYTKGRMTISELIDIGYTRRELYEIYHSELNEDRRIAYKKNEHSDRSTIVFDTDELERNKIALARRRR